MSAERTVEAALLGLPTPCWRCGAHNVPIVAVIVGVPRDVSEDGMALIDTEMLGAELAHLVDRRLQRELRCGPIARRSSRTRPEAYWSNGCAKCGAIFGGFHLTDALDEKLSLGVDPRTLEVARLRLPFKSVQRCLTQMFDS